MEHAYTYALSFVTLFLLSKAELSGSWYSANVINDGDFSPKPIQEIFSTESPPPFSSTHPIVVLSSTTAAPPISTSMSSGSFSPSTAITSEELISTFSTTPSTYPTQSSYVPLLPSTQQTIDPNAYPQQKPDFDLRQPPFPYQFPQGNKQQQQVPPNYFLIYQQAPQSMQNLPPQNSFLPSSTIRPEVSTPQSTFSTFESTFSTPPSTFSTQPPTSVSTGQSTFSTFQPEISTPSTTLSTFRPATSSQSTLMTFQPSSDSTFPSNLPSSPRATSASTAPPTRTTRIASTMAPCNNQTNVLQKFPTLRIRMISPAGSITNVNINPTTSTRRPTTKRTTTTRKPTTTRTKRNRNNRNTFNKCVDACEGGGRRPICGAPLAQLPIDPSKLKGFPSICHMACHNSFKRDQYEMVVEGRCGRLRTRIRTVDSEKIKRPDLNKAQYTLVNAGPETVVEVSSLARQKRKSPKS